MRWAASRDVCLVLFLIGLLASSCGAFSEEAKGTKEKEERLIAILDPIDLHTQRTDPEWGEFIRKSFVANPKWKVIPRDTLAVRFKDYKIDPKTPCHEFQCAFDAGNVLSAEFVMFGSITNDDDLYAYTLNLVHVPTSQTVWSRVGEVRKRQLGIPSAAMEAALDQIAKNLGPDQVRTGRREKRGLLSVLDLSAAGSTPSRIVAERVATHLYASRNYDIMGRKEMEELLTALDINKAAFVPTDSAIFWLGGKMDISHLVYSRLLATKNGGLQLQLALYDITARKKVREWPSQSTLDFSRLLEFEDKFFTSLFQLPDYDAGGSAVVGKSNAITWAGVGLSLAAGATFGYLSYSAVKQSNREYARFQAAQSSESAVSLRGKVEDQNRNSVVFGALSGLCAMGAGGFLIFSF